VVTKAPSDAPHGRPEHWVGVGFICDTTRSLVNEAQDPIWRLVRRESAATDIPAESDDEAAVVLVFLVPGTMVRPHDFSGIRTSSYFKEHHAKQLQVAVPPGLTTGGDLKAFLAQVFTDAPSIALKALRRQGVTAEMSCATEAARRIVAHLDEAVADAEETWAVRRLLWERPSSE
jgi:hypothetical protein